MYRSGTCACALLIAMSLNACVVWAPQQRTAAELLAKRTEKVVRVNRSTMVFAPSVVGDSLIGTMSKARAAGETRRSHWDSTRVAFALGDIQQLDVRLVAPVRTTMLAVFVVASLLAVAIASQPMSLFGPGDGPIITLTR
jgi:hypothetical protein